MSSYLNIITRRQSEILEYCVHCWEAGESLPSLREICSHFGYASTRAASDHLKALKVKGYIAKDSGNARSYRLTEKATGLPILGGISAGLPISETEYPETSISINTRSFGIINRCNAFFLRVYGDSMIGRHIFDGDIVLVEKSNSFKNEDIVVALIDNESTLKTLIKKDGHPWLRSENPHYPNLIPTSSLQIQGIVRATIRVFSS